MKLFPFDALRRSVTLAVGFLLLLLPAAVLAADNILTNPGFEDGPAGLGLWDAGTGWSLDSTIAHSGLNSYKCTSAGSGAMRTISVTTGGTYTLTGWLKTQSISSSTKTAYLCVEWYTGSDYTGGVYISLNGSGTDGWQQFEPRSFSIPATATRVTMGIGTYNGVSGTVWFDDLEFDNPVSINAEIRYPPYRDTLFSNLDKKMNIGIKATGNPAFPISSCSVAIKVEDAQHTSLLERIESYDPARDWCGYEYSLPSMVAGSSYTVTTNLVYLSTDTVVATDSATVFVSDIASSLPSVYFDAHNRTVVNGQLFFPLGIYVSTDIVSAALQLDMLKAAKLNTILPTSSAWITPEEGATFLNACASKGIKVIYNVDCCVESGNYWPGYVPRTSFGSWNGTFSVLQGMITTFKDYPAMLAWYTNDEQDGDAVVAELQRNYNFIRSSDTNHPVLQMLIPHENLQAHVANTDVLGTDHFPIDGAKGGAPDYTEILQEIDKTNTVFMNSKPAWPAIETTVVEWETQTRYATYQDIVNECYQAIIHGARGILFFCMTDVLRATNSAALWQTTVQASTHVYGLTDIALGVDAPFGKTLSCSNSSISVLTRVLENGDIYAMAVNPYTSNAAATFSIGADIVTSSYVPVGLPGSPTGQLAVSGTGFTDTLEPLGTRVYRLYRAGASSGTTTDGETVEALRPTAYPSVITPNHDGRNDKLNIRYSAGADDKMTLKLYDLKGMLVYERRLEGEHPLGNNMYLTAWDGTDFNGNAVPQGLYLVTVFKGDKTSLKRLVQVLR